LEIEHRFGGGAGAIVPLGRLGDVDGDGRADPCVVRKGRFLCDTGHDFGRAEVQIPYTVTGGQAVLVGDIDGDGRDDPCQFLAGHFRCDTAHDGGAFEVDIAFGAEIWSDRGSEGVALLGDVDGDGRDDPCVTPTHSGEFRCDTAHDGGAPETVITFGAVGGGGAPILADFNGDGRDDPCISITGIFSCDTAHDGGAAELEFSLGRGVPNAWPLIGNLDGV
jgi:hypothetical protein